MLARGRELLAAAADLADAVERFKAGDGRIDIGTMQSVTTVILPVVVRRLREQYSGCDVRLSEEEPDQPQTGDLDLLFYDSRIDGAVEHLQLLDDPYLLVARRGAFPDGPVRVEQLDDLPMVAWPATCDQPRLEQALAHHGVRPRIVFRTASNEALLSMVRAGMGPAVLPWLALHGSDAWADERIRVHDLRPSPPPREIYLCWQAGRSHSPLAARAIDITVELAADLKRLMP